MQSERSTIWGNSSTKNWRHPTPCCTSLPSAPADSWRGKNLSLFGVSTYKSYQWNPPYLPGSVWRPVLIERLFASHHHQFMFNSIFCLYVTTVTGELAEMVERSRSMWEIEGSWKSSLWSLWGNRESKSDEAIVACWMCSTVCFFTLLCQRKAAPRQRHGLHSVMRRGHDTATCLDKLCINVKMRK